MDSKVNRWIVVMFTVALVLAACRTGEGVLVELLPSETPQPSNTSAPPDTPTPPAAEPPPDNVSEYAAPPTFYLIVGDQRVEGKQGSYCWVGGSDSMGLCVDIIWPPEIEQYTELPAGEPIRLHLDDPLPDALFLTLYDDLLADPILNAEVARDGAEVTWDVTIEPGDYVLIAFARWEVFGDSMVVFPVTIPL